MCWCRISEAIWSIPISVARAAIWRKYVDLQAASLMEAAAIRRRSAGWISRVFSCGVTPMTGKYRMECAEVNGPVSLCGCLVMPGDLIVADGSGVCIVPNELVEEVLEKAEKSAAKEEEFSRILEAGGGIEELKKAK